MKCVRCDRCGGFHTEGCNTFLDVTEGDRLGATDAVEKIRELTFTPPDDKRRNRRPGEIDLCPDCYLDFLKWWNDDKSL